MTILTICLSNSTITETTTNLRSRHHVKQSKALPVRGAIVLVGYTVIHLERIGFRKLLEVRIPWLNSSTHMVAGSANESVANKHVPSFIHDSRRFGTNGIYLTSTTAETHCTGVNEEFEISESVIPAVYDIEVLDAATGEPYDNISHLILKFKINRSGLIT